MFHDFDFSLLNSKLVKEDTVREELISPLLKALGYSISGNHRIIRSFALPHPYVYIGTKKNNIKIIPDYLLIIDDKYKWVLDAKGPFENILSGKNVEQAYSYAIHPEIRASVYALCNGHQLAIFNINKTEPVFIVKLKDLSCDLNELKKILSPLAFSNPRLLNFKPDFGLALHKLGYPLGNIISFKSLGLPFIARVNDHLYSAVVEVGPISEGFDGGVFCLSLDFSKNMLDKILGKIDKKIAFKIKESLSRQPYSIEILEGTPVLKINAKIMGEIYENKDEQYSPLRIIDIDYVSSVDG